MNFGERLKGLRTDKGLTQPQLAQLAGIEQSYLSKLENDKSVPSAEMFTSILAGLGGDETTFLASLDREALHTTLRHIPSVARYTTQAVIVQESQTKRWLYGAALAWILGFAMMLAANEGIFVSNRTYTYRSPGVVLAGEADNVFDTKREILEHKLVASMLTIQEMSKELATFKSDRLRPETRDWPASRGTAYIEEVDGGRRRFDFVRSDYAKSQANNILQYLGAIVLVCGFVGLFIEWQLRRMKSRRP